MAYINGKEILLSFLKGDKGDDYVLTDADKAEIAAMVGGVSSKYDCYSGVHSSDFSQAYLKITVPNKSTILDLIIKLDEDGAGCNAEMYDFITWRLHLKGNFCNGQCSTVLQDATNGNCTLHYTTTDDYVSIYVGFKGCCIEAYINGILESISATFEKVATLPSGALAFTIK